MSRNTEYMRWKRAQWVKEGLTTEGKPRKNIRHPDLKGLDKSIYHTKYMRWQRAKDRAAWEKIDQLADNIHKQYDCA